MRHSALTLVLPFVLYFGGSSFSYAMTVYKWTTPNGEHKMADTIPSDQRHLGYQVVDAMTGEVIRKVESKAEYAERKQITESKLARLESIEDEAQEIAVATADDSVQSIRSARGDQSNPGMVDLKIEETRKAIRDVLVGRSDESLADLQQQMTALYRKKAEAGWL